MNNEMDAEIDADAAAGMYPLQDTWAALIAIDADCHIRLFNREAERIIGLAAEEALGQHVCDVLSVGCDADAANPRRCPWWRAIEGTERRLQPREMTTHVGARRLDILIGVRPSMAPDGGRGALITFIDLSHHRTLEQVRSSLMADVFHELRSPISAISLAAHFLAADFADLPLERIQGLLHTIQRNSSTLLADLNDLLNRSTFTTAEPRILPRAIDLAGVVEQATWKLQPLLDERGQRVQVEVDAVPLLWADERRVEQVLVNLLANANKYSQPDDEILLRAEVRRGQVRVSVEDHGPGIPPDDRARVFERFYRAGGTAESVTGAGLGLAIVRQIIEAHGGRVGVEASSPQGARFWFTLPLAPADAARSSRQRQVARG